MHLVPLSWSTASKSKPALSRSSWLSRSKLNQSFRIDSDAVLHKNLIRWIWFGSAEVRRLNWALVVSLVVVILVLQTQQYSKNSNVLRNLDSKLSHLKESQCQDLEKLLQEYKDLFSRRPRQDRSDLSWCGCRWCCSYKTTPLQAKFK